MRRTMLLLVMILAAAPLVTLTSAGVARTRAFTPAFHLTSCPRGVFPAGVDVDCGYIRVPERWGRPGGRQIRVTAAYVHGSAEHVRQDPIVFLDGGPSFGAVSPFALGTYFAGGTYLGDRDIVLVDTRGTGLSQPRLGCPELDQAEVTAFYAAPLIDSQGPQLMDDALTHCWNRLVDAGADPAAYTTDESAADLEALRKALGVERWNLLAISADGQLGLTYMRLFPKGIRSAVIDSGISTQADWGIDMDRGVVRMLQRIFAGCAADPVCDARFPGIRADFFHLVRRLQREPVRITFPDFRPKPVALRLSGAGLVSDTGLNIWPGNADFPQGIGWLLDTVWRQTHGELQRTYREGFGTGPVTNEHGEDFVATGKSMSYVCHDSLAFLTRKDRLEGARAMPYFRQRYLSPDYDLADGYFYPLSPAACRSWPVGSAPPIQHERVHSNIPTLAFGGEYDLGVPPYVERTVVAGLTRSTFVKIPAASHLQLSAPTHGSSCARSIAESFLAAPTRSPDTSCVAKVPKFDFGAAVASLPSHRLAATGTRPYTPSWWTHTPRARWFDLAASPPS